MSKYEIILTVCEMGTISKAAAKLNYSQSAVSQTIQSFEKDLGVPLFKRSKSGVQVLPGAEDIICSLRHIVEEEKRISGIADQLKNMQQGLVRLGSIASIATTWLPQLLSAFSVCYPNIKFELYVEPFKEIRAMLDEEIIDFALTSQMEAQGFEFVSLVKDELVLILPTDHPFASSVSVPVSWLENQTLIIPDKGADHEIREILENHNVSFCKSQYIVKEDYATAIRLVECGLGISIMPRLFLEESNAKLCIRSLSEHYYRSLGIAHLPNPILSFAAKNFIGFAEEWLRSQASE